MRLFSDSEIDQVIQAMLSLKDIHVYKNDVTENSQSGQVNTRLEHDKSSQSEKHHSGQGNERTVLFYYNEKGQ